MQVFLMVTYMTHPSTASNHIPLVKREEMVGLLAFLFLSFLCMGSNWVQNIIRVTFHNELEVFSSVTFVAFTIPPPDPGVFHYSDHDSVQSALYTHKDTCIFCYSHHLPSNVLRSITSIISFLFALGPSSHTSLLCSICSTFPPSFFL